MWYCNAHETSPIFVCQRFCWPNQLFWNTQLILVIRLANFILECSSAMTWVSVRTQSVYVYAGQDFSAFHGSRHDSVVLFYCITFPFSYTVITAWCLLYCDNIVRWLYYDNRLACMIWDVFFYPITQCRQTKKAFPLQHWSPDFINSGKVMLNYSASILFLLFSVYLYNIIY